MDLSVVIPVYNEVDNLAVICQQIKDVLGSFEGNYEVLVVDDGSTNGTFALLERMHGKDPSLRIIRLSRNFGQTAALAAGIAYAQGERDGMSFTVMKGFGAAAALLAEPGLKPGRKAVH